MNWNKAIVLRNPHPIGEPQFVLVDDLKAAEKHPVVQKWASEVGPRIGYSDVLVCVDGGEIIVDFGTCKMRIDKDKA
jgi:hypothetical protein